MPQDFRQDFHANLDAVRNDIARLGAYVVELIPRVTEILLQQDLEGAEYVLRGDAEIDERTHDVEERALSFLALQAPVAGDLRQVAAALRLAPEIERSADLCCNIAKAARRLYGRELDPKLRGGIQRMSDQAQQEYREAVEAYLTVDASRAADPGKRESQKRLAEEVTRLIHGETGLASARRATEIFFGAEIGDLSDKQLGEIFADVPSKELAKNSLADGTLSIVDALVEAGLAKSKGDARRTVEQGGAYVNNRRVDSIDRKLAASDLASETVMVLRSGKKKYALLRFK